MSHAAHSPAPSSPGIGSSIGTPTQSVFDTPAHARDDASSFTTASVRSPRIDERSSSKLAAAPQQHRSLLAPPRSARPERRSSSSLPASWSAPAGLSPSAPRLAPKRSLSRSPSPLGREMRHEPAPEQLAAGKRHHRKAQRPSIAAPSTVLSDTESAAPFGGSVYNDVPSFRHFRGPPFDDLSPETSVDMHIASASRRERRTDAVKFTHPWQDNHAAQRRSGGSAVSPRQVHSGLVSAAQPSRSSRLVPQARHDLSDDDDDGDSLDEPVPRRTHRPRPPQLSMLTDASGRVMEPADDSSGLENDERLTAERKPSLPMPRDAELLTDSDSDGSSPAAAAISRYLNEKPRDIQRRAASRQHVETAEAFEVAALRRQVEQLQMCLTQRGQLSPEVLRAAVSPVPEERPRKRESQMGTVPSSSAYREPPSARHAARSPRPVREAALPDLVRAKEPSRRAEAKQREDAMRIQDLAQKVEQLEALFRYSAMSPVGERSRTATSMAHHSFGEERDVETPRASVSRAAPASGRYEQRHSSVDGCATEREAVGVPKRKTEGRSKTVRLASSSRSTGEHSAAESAFHYNPTPYSINQLAPAPGAASADAGLRRKKGAGVARFIMGAASARRADGSTGEPAPLASTKMKRAGRGGLVAVSPEQKRVPL